ncbi:hypothetical protein FQN57_003231 [Myotisia sp. PD_48]|nr:hypothetical protein FQN57_003231 [Myotisia sp. PD_48]
MHLNTVLTGAIAAAATFSTALAGRGHGRYEPDLRVPRCPKKATATYDKSVPDKKRFPRTEVDLCYDNDSMHFTFKAFEEKYFYYDPKQGTNDDIWQYEVMEAFIQAGDKDPSTYLEFEVNPGNTTYQAIIYNPAKDRTGAFDHLFVSTPAADGFSSATAINRKAETWVSQVRIPIKLFNVDDARNTRWRMNFFRTVTNKEMFPNQDLGAWSVPNEASFHISRFFKHVLFV